MLHRLIAAVLGVLGLLAIGLGVASATVWRADDILVATATADAASLITTDPGVLDLAGDPVTITATSPDGSPVVLAIGRDTDVAGWVGSDASVRVTGLDGWHALATESFGGPEPSQAATDGATGAATDGATPVPTEAPATDAAAVPADEAPAEAPADPTGSDMWVASATGAGTATLTWVDEPGRWSLLVAGLGGAPTTLELAWPQTVTTPWLWPGVVVGSLLLLAGLALGIRLWLRARRGVVGPEWHPVTTGLIPVVPAVGASGAAPAAAGSPAADTGAPLILTRRQLREAQAAGVSAGRRRDRGAVPTGSTPSVGAGATVSPEPGRSDQSLEASGATRATAPSVSAHAPAVGSPTGSAPSAPTSGTPWRRREPEASAARRADEPTSRPSAPTSPMNSPVATGSAPPAGGAWTPRATPDTSVAPGRSVSAGPWGPAASTSPRTPGAAVPPTAPRPYPSAPAPTAVPGPLGRRSRPDLPARTDQTTRPDQTARPGSAARTDLPARPGDATPPYLRGRRPDEPAQQSEGASRWVQPPIAPAAPSQPSRDQVSRDQLSPGGSRHAGAARGPAPTGLDGTGQPSTGRAPGGHASTRPDPVHPGPVDRAVIPVVAPEPDARQGWMSGWSASRAARREASAARPASAPAPAAAAPPQAQPAPALSDDASESPAARADAWRRAWGFPQEGSTGGSSAGPDGQDRHGDEGSER